MTEDFTEDSVNKYKAVTTIGDTDYVGGCPNKRSAETAAARYALLNKYGINPDYVAKDFLDMK